MILPCTDCIYRKVREEGHREFIGCSDNEKKKGFHYDDFFYHHTCDNYKKEGVCPTKSTIMDCKSLMIGDWVTYTNKYMSSVLLCEVVAINNPSGEVILRNLQSNKIDEFGNKDYKVITTRYEDIHPIPLTTEILEKNIPFERYWDATRSNPKGSVTEWRMDTDISTIFIHDSRDKKGEYTLEIHIRGYANYGVKKNIYYVHELQHALRLCGLDKLADNFLI